VERIAVPRHEPDEGGVGWLGKIAGPAGAGKSDGGWTGLGLGKKLEAGSGDSFRKG
jgi:hypothetical protein